MKLFTGPLSMYSAKAHIALLEKGAEVDVVMVPFDLRSRYEPKHRDVVRINPKAQIPVLVDGDLEIFDSTQIFEYLEDRFPDPPLWPGDIRARALARRLELESDEVFFPHVIKLFSRPDDRDAIIAGAHAFLNNIDRALGAKPYLAKSYTYADIALFMAIFHGEIMGVRLQEHHSSLQRWRDRIAERPAVRHVIVPMVNWMATNGIRMPPWARSLLSA